MKKDWLRSRCMECNELLVGEAATARHVKATKHVRYESVFGEPDPETPPPSPD